MDLIWTWNKSKWLAVIENETFLIWQRWYKLTLGRLPWPDGTIFALSQFNEKVKFSLTWFHTCPGLLCRSKLLEDTSNS